VNTSKSAKDILRPIVPSALKRARRALFGWRWFRGRYQSWNDANALCPGYAAPEILDKVLRATLEVKGGRAAFERDSVLFQEPEIEVELMKTMELVGQATGGRLRVLDFGGSLGSTYWQHRAHLARYRELRWDVVEQAHFVQAGREYVEDDVLHFYSSIYDAGGASDHDVILASGVINYMPRPQDTVSEFSRSRVPFVLLHNLALHDLEPDYVMIQHVPPEIYTASYPIWFLNRDKFLSEIQESYSILRSYPSSAVWNRGWSDYPSTGMLLKRRDSP